MLRATVGAGASPAGHVNRIEWRRRELPPRHRTRPDRTSASASAPRSPHHWLIPAVALQPSSRHRDRRPATDRQPGSSRARSGASLPGHGTDRFGTGYPLFGVVANLDESGLEATAERIADVRQ